MLDSGPGEERPPDLSQSSGVAKGLPVRLVILETSSQLLGLVDDLVNGSWHASDQRVPWLVHKIPCLNAFCKITCERAALELIR